jgi:tetratricopeptide (TPR) repeat protein
MPFSVFISYSHRDRVLRQELENHLSNLRRQNIIASWYDGDISPGDEWKPQITEHLNTDQIILLLISADFMASDFCYSIEMAQAIARHDANQARVLPIILRPTDWKGAPFSKLKFLPTDGKAVTRWPTHDDAFEDIVKGIREAIDDLQKKETPVAQKESASQPIGLTDSASMLIQLMEKAFADHDWPDVIRKASYLIRRTSGNVSSTVYRLQGLALLEKGEIQQAQEALETALALANDREQRLHILQSYTHLLISQERWNEVLPLTSEARLLDPHNLNWVLMQGKAQIQVKTKEQWVEEANSLYSLKRYGEALEAYNQAIRLDSNDADVYNNKGNVLDHLGKRREAQQAYDRAKQLGYKG